jgi:Calcineurin-like phosphoesterase
MEAPEVDALLARLDPLVSPEPALVQVNPPGARTLAAIGDTHGDWRSSEKALAWFLAEPKERAFVGLGDYVDRAPPDSPAGSAVNALFLLSVKASFPDRVFLLQGNHEAARRIPVVPHTLPEEMDRRWGTDRRRYARLMGLLERGPLAGYTLSGVFLAHAGFPSRLTTPWTDRFRMVDETLLVDLLWRDVEASHLDRGLSVPFDERALDEFLQAAGLHTFLRGHDPNVVGQSLYHDHCLTLHTSRRYAQYGGVLAALVPIDRPVRSTREIEVRHL